MKAVGELGGRLLNGNVDAEAGLGFIRDLTHRATEVEMFEAVRRRAREVLAEKAIPYLSPKLKAWDRDPKQGLMTATAVAMRELVEFYATSRAHSVVRSDDQRKNIRRFLELCLTARHDHRRDPKFQEALPAPKVVGLALLESENFDLLRHHGLIEVIPRIHKKLIDGMKKSPRKFDGLNEYERRSDDCLIFAGEADEYPELRPLVGTFLALLARLRLRNHRTMIQYHS